MRAWLDSILLNLGYVPRAQFDALVQSNKELDDLYQKAVSENQELRQDYDSLNSQLDTTITSYKESLSRSSESIAALTNQVALLNTTRAQQMPNPNLSNVSWPRLKKILERQDLREMKTSLVQDPRNAKTEN